MREAETCQCCLADLAGIALYVRYLDGYEQSHTLCNRTVLCDDQSSHGIHVVAFGSDPLGVGRRLFANAPSQQHCEPENQQDFTFLDFDRDDGEGRHQNPNGQLVDRAAFDVTEKERNRIHDGKLSPFMALRQALSATDIPPRKAPARNG